MRKTTMFILAAGAIALGSALLPLRPAVAMMLPGASGLAPIANQANAVEKVVYVCRRFWNGRRWVRRCWYRPGPFAGPYIYARPYWYYGPRYRYWRRW